MEKISVVVPCYNEEKAIPYFYREIGSVQKNMSEYEFEIIFVDDGSKDQTLTVAKELANKDNQIKYISFPEILEKKLQFMQDFQKLLAIML